MSEVKQTFVTFGELYSKFSGIWQSERGYELWGEDGVYLVFNKCLYTTFYSSVIMAVTATDEGYEEAEMAEGSYLRSRLDGWFERISEKYAKYVKLRLALADSPASEAISSITTKNNDTPTDQGDYSTDAYTSSVVRTTQTTGLSGYDKFIQNKERLIDTAVEDILDDFEKNFVIMA